MFNPANSASLCAFLVIVASVIAGLVAAAFVVGSERVPAAGGRQAARVLVLTMGWLILLGCSVGSGLLEAQPMPRLMIFFAVSNLAGVLLALGPYGRRLAFGLPVWSLVAFQGFRLPLELVLHSWAAQGVIPPTMTWTGSNFDVAAGAVALLAAPFSVRFRAAAWLANLLGLASLANVMRVAVLSSPLPFAWRLTSPLLLAFHVPYFLIVPVCIAGALAGHLILTRKLLVS